MAGVDGADELPEPGQPQMRFIRQEFASIKTIAETTATIGRANQIDTTVTTAATARKNRLNPLMCLSILSKVKCFV